MLANDESWFVLQILSFPNIMIPSTYRQILVTWLVERMAKVEAGLVLEVVEPLMELLEIVLTELLPHLMNLLESCSWVDFTIQEHLTQKMGIFWFAAPRKWVVLCCIAWKCQCTSFVNGVLMCSLLCAFEQQGSNSKVQSNKWKPMEKYGFVLACHGKRTNGMPWHNNKWCSFAMASQNKNAEEKPDWEWGFHVKMLFHFTSSSLSPHFHFESGNFAMMTKLCWQPSCKES